MFKGINYFMYLLDVDPFWYYLLIVILLLSGIVKCLYPWQRKWKSIKTKDENGNEVTIHSRLDI